MPRAHPLLRFFIPSFPDRSFMGVWRYHSCKILTHAWVKNTLLFSSYDPSHQFISSSLFLFHLSFLLRSVPLLLFPLFFLLSFLLPNLLCAFPNFCLSFSSSSLPLPPASVFSLSFHLSFTPSYSPFVDLRFLIFVSPLLPFLSSASFCISSFRSSFSALRLFPYIPLPLCSPRPLSLRSLSAFHPFALRDKTPDLQTE